MSQVPQSDQMRASGSGRRKVALPPGRSQLDWVRNSASLPQLRPRAIALSELRQHAAPKDAWIAIHGKVFDVTPYLGYHPGGIPMILSGAGKDATKLFNKYHAWVNPDFMLARCHLGFLTVTDSDDSESEVDEDSAKGDNEHALSGYEVEPKSKTASRDIGSDSHDSMIQNAHSDINFVESSKQESKSGDDSAISEKLDALRVNEISE